MKPICEITDEKVKKKIICSLERRKEGLAFKTNDGLGNGVKDRSWQDSLSLVRCLKEIF